MSQETGRQSFNELVKDICEGSTSLEDIDLRYRHQIMSQVNLILTAVKFAKKTKVQQAIIIAGLKQNLKTVCAQPVYRKRARRSGTNKGKKNMERKILKIETRYNSFGLHLSLLTWEEFVMSVCVE